MKIKAYLKPQCGWSMGIRAIMDTHGLEYEDIDIINCPENYAEMVRKSGQPLSPCVEIDGIMLADVSGEEVEAYMLSNDLVKANEKLRMFRRIAVVQMKNTKECVRNRKSPSQSAFSESQALNLFEAAVYLRLFSLSGQIRHTH